MHAVLRGHYRFGLVILLLLAVAFVLRLHNLSSYNLYPDSYQNLVVAHNLATSHNPVGPMGPDGMYYPDFFSWTRPLYPLLIIAGSWFTSAEAAAHIIATGASLVAVVVAYFLLKQLTGRRREGLLAAALVAINFGLSVWSGLILTEGLAVCMLLLTLLCIVKIYPQRSSYGSLTPLVAGLVMGLAVLTRYEYLLLLLPLCLYLLSGPSPLAKTATFLQSALIIIALWLIVAVRDYSVSALWYQLRPLIIYMIISFIVIAVAFWAVWKHKIPKVKLSVKTYRQLLIGLLVILVGIALINKASSIGSYVLHDFILIISSLIGLFLMISSKKYRLLLITLVACTLLLGAAYIATNPLMERYATHLLPLLVIPAAIGLGYVIDQAKLRLSKQQPTIASIAMLALISLQLTFSFNGIGNWSGGLWRNKGYEQLSSDKLQPLLAQDDIIVAALPESYFVGTQHATYGVGDRYPYFYFNPSLSSQRQVVIVNDEAMRQLYPMFSQLIDTRLSSYKSGQYWVGSPLRYVRGIYPEVKPTTIYTVKVQDIQKQFASTKP